MIIQQLIVRMQAFAPKSSFALLTPQTDLAPKYFQFLRSTKSFLEFMYYI